MHRFISARLLILIAGLLVLQQSLSLFPFFWSRRPDLFYLIVLDYAFFWSWEFVPFFGLAIGLVRDLAGGHLFGIETVSLTVTSFLLSLGIQKLERDNVWVRGGICFLFAGLTEALSFSLGTCLEGFKLSPFLLLHSVFWTSLYTVVVSPIFFGFTHRWFKRYSFLKQYELF